MNHSMNIVRCFAATLGLAAAAFAQSAQIPAAPQAKPVALVNARIFTAEPGMKIIERGYVIFDKGVIVSIGPGETPDLPAECAKYDCTGLTVMPGFIHVGSELGLVEVQQVNATDDRNEFGQYHPEIRACVAVNPDSDLIPVARSGGVLNTVVFPQSGVVAGHASVMRVDGWTSEDQTLVPRAGLIVRWPMSEPIVAPWMDKSVDDQKKEAAKNLKELDAFFDKAKTWMLAREKDPKTEGDLRFENMIAVLKGEEPVYFVANSPGQIEGALLWAKSRNLRPIIWGGAGAASCIPLLKDAKAAVVIAGTHRLPARRADSVDAIYALPKKLADAGIPFCIATGSDPSNDRHLPDHAATAVAYGLSRDLALQSVTSGAAQIAGVGDKLGSIAPGKLATLQIVDGEPLEMTTEPVLIFSEGRRVDFGDRQKRLDVKYREKYRRMGLLPAEKPPAHPAPVPR
ncbi:MAG: amidohydrolase family protein [Planctomycetes bacterium]|nr:amidohydrolase family protein [Planctomycetota bacterium]